MSIAAWERSHRTQGAPKRPILLLALGHAVGCDDGGEGDCAVDEDESVCDQDCYEANDCGAIDDSDAAAVLSACIADCAPDA